MYCSRLLLRLLLPQRLRRAKQDAVFFTTGPAHLAHLTRRHLMNDSVKPTKLFLRVSGWRRLP